MQFESSHLIAAPVERVWQFLDDDEKRKLWMPEVEDTVYPDGNDKENPVGVRFRQRIREGGRISEYEGEVTAYNPPSLLGVRLSNPQFASDVIYRLRQEDGGTRLDYSAELSLNSWIAKVMGVIARPLTSSIIRRHMRNLKRVAEGSF